MGKLDPRFDYAANLPSGVPAVEEQPTAANPHPLATGPGQATYYFPIKLDKCSPTGVFFPTGYSFPDDMNVLLYFHGHKLGQFTNINEYWSGNLNGIKLRQDILSSGKQNLVLIAPTMGESPGSSLNADMGIFKEPAGADKFLEEVRNWIGKYVPQYVAKGTKPNIQNVVIAGHSGAGGILSQQAKTMKSRLCEVWGFDSMYGEGWLDKDKKIPIDVVGNWRQTAVLREEIDFEFLDGWFPVPTVRPSTLFYFYWAGGSPGANMTKLKEKVADAGLTNVIVEQNAHLGGKYHFETVTAHFGPRVTGAKCF